MSKKDPSLEGAIKKKVQKIKTGIHENHLEPCLAHK